MSYELHRREAEQFVVPPIPLSEVEEESMDYELPNVGELGVDDGHESSVYVGEGGGERLSLED